MIAGAILVVTLLVWMLRTAKRLKQAIESRVEALASRTPGRHGSAAAAGLFGLTFILILREGIVTISSLTASFAFTRLPRDIDPPLLLTPDARGLVRLPKADLA